MAQYFAERVFEGKPKKADKAFEKLEPAEKKKLKKEYKRCRDTYMANLEVYLKSLTREVCIIKILKFVHSIKIISISNLQEMVDYANRHRQTAEDQAPADEWHDVSSCADD